MYSAYAFAYATSTSGVETPAARCIARLPTAAATPHQAKAHRIVTIVCPHRVSGARRGAAQNLRAQLGVEFELFETLKRAPVRAGAAATGVPGTRHRSRATDKECNRRLGIYTHSRIIIRLCLKAISASVTPTVGRCS